MSCVRCLFKQFRDLEAKHHDQVLITFRNFPLDQHKNALLAAKAVEAAAAQGKFMEMMAMIYDNQETLKIDDSAGAVFATYAKALGLDVDRFELDRHGQAVIDRINFDLERAK